MEGIAYYRENRRLGETAGTAGGFDFLALLSAKQIVEKLRHFRAGSRVVRVEAAVRAFDNARFYKKSQSFNRPALYLAAVHKICERFAAVAARQAV